MVERAKVAEHEFRFEPESGLIHIVQNGSMTEDDVVQMLTHTESWERLLAPGAPALYLVDSRNATGITSEARKVVAKASDARKSDAYCAIFGAGFAVRVVLNLVFKAMALTSNKTMTRFALTESEARELSFGRPLALDPDRPGTRETPVAAFAPDGSLAALLADERGKARPVLVLAAS